MEFIDYNGKDITNNIVQPVNNLLINGDFQSWQRGENISFNDIKTTTNGFKYFADMWCTYFSRGEGNNYIFEKVDNGVKITTSRDISISQFFTDKLDSNKYYTFVASINGNIHYMIIKGNESNNSESLQYMNKEDTGFEHRFIIRVKNNDIVNFVDLFEGYVVYPHKKEDYSIALVRCRRKIKMIEIPPWSYLPVNVITAKSVSATISVDIEMDSKIPLVTIEGASSTNFRLHNSGVGIKNVGIGGGVGSKNTICLYFELLSEITIPQYSGTHFGTTDTSVKILLSCEPLWYF